MAATLAAGIIAAPAAAYAADSTGTRVEAIEQAAILPPAPGFTLVGSYPTIQTCAIAGLTGRIAGRWMSFYCLFNAGTTHIDLWVSTI